jgi:hypothetical protein
VESLTVAVKELARAILELSRTNLALANAMRQGDAEPEDDDEQRIYYLDGTHNHGSEL